MIPVTHKPVGSWTLHVAMLSLVIGALIGGAYMRHVGRERWHKHIEWAHDLDDRLKIGEMTVGDAQREVHMEWFVELLHYDE